LSISIQQISKDFGKKNVLNNVSIDISQGEIVGFAGLNGAGKTTTIKIASGVLHPSTGDVLINGTSIIKRKLEIASEVSWVPEFPMLDPMEKPKEIFQEIGNYLSYSRREIKERFEESMARVSMTENMNKRIGSMSNGMKKRIHIAIGLFQDSGNYLMDETFNGLDPEGTEFLRNHMLYLKKQGKSILLSTHILSEIKEICDRIVIIKDGKIVRDAKVSTLDFDGLIRIRVKSPDQEIIKKLEGDLNEYGEVNIVQLPVEGIYEILIRKPKLGQGKSYQIAEILDSAGLNVMSVKEESEDIEEFFRKAIRE
jgi:ABC-2 type transport system ATP-binding protein